MARVIVDHDKCDLCGLCIELCPAYVFYISNKGVVEADSGKCIECYGCIPLCPQNAIDIIEPDP